MPWYKLISRKQKFFALFVVLSVTAGGGYLSWHDKIDVLGISYFWFTNSLLLLGFAITTLSFFTGNFMKSLDAAAFKRMTEKSRSYVAMSLNFKLLIYFLYANTIIGFLLVIYPHNLWSLIFQKIISILLLLDISILWILLWYAISRFVRLVLAMGKKQGNRN